MPFDLDTLKDKLDSATLAALRSHVDELSTTAETAQGKLQTLRQKADAETARARKAEERVSAIEEWAGVEAGSDLTALPAPKGQPEAAKQFEAQIKRLTRERDEAVAERDTLGGEIKGMKRNGALAEAIQEHKFKNPADVQVLLQNRLVEEGDELRFKTDDGKLVPLKEGAAWFAKTRPDYVEPSGDNGGGSGFKGNAGGGGEGKPSKKPERKDFPNEVEYFKAAAAHSEQ